MPLVTEIRRDGETLSVPWDYTTLSIMYSVAVAEAEPHRNINPDLTFGEAVSQGKYMDFSQVPIYYLDWEVPLMRQGVQVVREDHTFTFPPESERNPVEINKGDVLLAHRESKS